jgi:hypothetical protein
MQTLYTYKYRESGSLSRATALSTRNLDKGIISMSSLFFTKAAARLLPFATRIEAIRVFKGAIQVTYLTKNGRCSTLDLLQKSVGEAQFIVVKTGN